MKALLLLLPVLTLALSSCSSTAPQPAPLTTVEKVDTKRYAGTWFEIARYPNQYEDDVHYVRTHYTANKDGSINIRNQARTPEGLRQSEGVAVPLPGSGNSKYKIKFSSFEGDYWIVGLDPQYRWAIVSEPNRDYLWFISKTPRVSKATYEEMQRVATAKGYDVSQLELVKQ